MMTEKRVVLGGGGQIHMSWSAIIGGAVVAIGLWILLYAFGLAVGLSSIDPSNPESAKTAGIGTGIWSLIAPLIALFAGGLVAARTAGVLDRGGAIIHGGVVWAVSTVAGALAMGMVLGALAGGVARIGASGASAAAGRGGPVAEWLGIDAQDVMAPINQRLRAEGKPTITPEQAQAVIQDSVRTAIRQGRFDSEMVVTSLAQQTPLSRQDAQEIAARLEAKWNQRMAGDQTPLERVSAGALTAADRTGKAFWGVFAALLLGLVSAVLGALVGVTRKQRAVAEAPAATTTDVPATETPARPSSSRRPGEVTP